MDGRRSTHPGRQQKPAPAPRDLHNLPTQLTSFIGREREIAEVKHLLAGTRLLTLTGTGGCGKTRLALHAVADLLSACADGVWIADLAGLSDPTFVPQAVASTLSVPEQPGRPLTESLVDALRPKSLLLLLDNCEHLLDACGQLVDALLRRCPNVRILATSRERLGIAGELTYRVPSLSLPHPEHPPTLEDLAQLEIGVSRRRYPHEEARMAELRVPEPPQFPAGPFVAGDAHGDRERTAWIGEIEHAPARVRTAVSGLTDHELDTKYRNWTIRQLVHHLADSHLNSYVRFKLALTEDRPTIKPYDESRWSQLADAQRVDVTASLHILDGLHARWTHLLRSLGHGEFERSFYHPESQETMPLWRALAYYVWHGRHHTSQIEWVKTHRLGRSPPGETA